MNVNTTPSTLQIHFNEDGSIMSASMDSLTIILDDNGVELTRNLTGPETFDIANLAEVLKLN